MQSRQLMIVAVAVILAFGAAFGIARAAGGDEPKAAAKAVKPAEVIEVGGATVSARVADAGGLPALRLPEKKQPETTGEGTSASTTGPAATVTPSTSSTVAPSSGGTTQTQSGATSPPVSTGGGGD